VKPPALAAPNANALLLVEKGLYGIFAEFTEFVNDFILLITQPQGWSSSSRTSVGGFPGSQSIVPGT